METADISITGMGLLAIFLIAPAFIMFRLKIKLVKQMLIAIFRMTIQLTLVGIYLRFLFEWNSLAINLLWLIVMVVVASGHILKGSQLKRKILFLPVLIAISTSLISILSLFLLLIVQPTPLYDARYIVPIGGMILGNLLSSNIVSLQHYTQSLKDRRKEFQTSLCFGATTSEAVRPFIREALKRALLPTITSIATLGLVSLPGMMTGQLLGGSFPMVAIKYQIAIMVAIFSSASISAYLAISLINRYIFDERGNVNREIFQETT